MPRRLPCQAVLDVRGHRPQLPSALERVAAAVAQIDEAVPVASGAEPVHTADQLVDVARLDELGVRGAYGAPVRAMGIG